MKYNNNNLKVIVFFTLLFITNAFSAYDSRIGIVLGILQIGILIYYLFKKKLEEYFLSYILFLVTSIEVSQFALGFESGSGIMYNFMRLPIINTNHLYLLILLPLTLIIGEKKLRTFYYNISSFKNIKLLTIMQISLIIIGILSGAMGILFNNNNITVYPMFWSYLITDILTFGMIVLVFFYLVYLLTTHKDFGQKLERFLICILISIVPSALITVIFKLRGYYNTSNDSEVVLLLPLVAFFGVMILIFPFFQQYKTKKLWIIYGVILLLIMLEYPSPLGGKWWLVVLAIPVIILKSYFRNITSKKIIITTFLIFFSYVIWLGISLANPNLDVTFGFENSITESKFDQATKTLFFWKEGWYDNLPLSPKFRFDEFINIIYEYIKSPQYLLLGKGFGGSILHHTNTLSWNNESAFSIEQIQAGVFIRLHESVNVIFLKFGLVGLLFFFTIIATCYKNIKHNPWIVLGMIWFTFYYGMYESLYFGLCCLVIGFYKVDIDFNKLLK